MRWSEQDDEKSTNKFSCSIHAGFREGERVCSGTEDLHEESVNEIFE